MSGPVQPEALLDELPALEASQRVARVRELGPGALRALGEAAEQMAVTDVGRALAATECLLPVADALDDVLGRSLARRARAHALCNAGRLDEGWLLCHEAAVLAEQAGDRVEAGRARLRSMQALGELGRFDDAVAAGEEALAAFTGAGEEALAARAEVNLGIVHQRRDEPARAVACFDRARPKLGDTPYALGTVDNNRGEALLALNDFEGARVAFESALAHYERADAAMVAAVAEGNLADLAARQGRLHLALDHFERSRRRFEMTSSGGHLARLLTEQAEAIGTLGLPEDALGLYEQALPELDRAGQALEAARARAGLGRTLVHLGRLSEAETALAAAARAFDELGHASQRARVDLVRAELAEANGRPGEARRLIHDALAVLHDRPIEAAAARHLLGRLAGDAAAAEADLDAALGIARRLDLAPLLADVLHTQGRLQVRQRRLREAVTSLREAVTQIERVRDTLQARRFRGAYLSGRVDVYEDLITVLLDHGAPDAADEAFAVAEKAKSRLLLEQVRPDLEPLPAPPGVGDDGERRLTGELATLQATLNAFYSRLGDEGTGGVPDGAWQRSVIDLERRLADVESRLSSTRGAAGLYARPVEAAAAARALPAGTTLVEYVIAGDEVIAFVLGEGGLEVIRSLTTGRRLRESLARLQFQLNRALRRGAHEGWRGARLLADVRAELCDLDGMLRTPLASAVTPGDRLLVVPHGPLHLLPFHALWDGSTHLVERCEVHVAPSASLFTRLAEPRAATGPPVVVGVADDAAPRIEAEARRVASALGAEAILGREATADRVRDAVRGAGVVHLACHARFAAATPLGSGVRLADRWLTAREVYDLRLEADLVTLSGCETGRSLVHDGDELAGLLSAFFAAGVPSLLVSLWRVDDETAAEMMTSFYDLLPGRAKAAALREAQLQGLRRHPHPAYWAPFQLVGRS